MGRTTRREWSLLAILASCLVLWMTSLWSHFDATSIGASDAPPSLGTACTAHARWPDRVHVGRSDWGYGGAGRDRHDDVGGCAAQRGRLGHGRVARRPCLHGWCVRARANTAEYSY
jgi:hypothetical protein